MSREEYIELRLKEAAVSILFEAAKERGYKGTLTTLINMFIAWRQSSETKQKITNQIVDFYDLKFNLTLVYLEGKLIKIL